MIATYETITTLDGIDFDSLYAGSVASIDVFYRFPEGVVTYEQRRQFIREHLQSAIDGTNPVIMREGDTFLMHKTVIDGQDLSLHAGYINAAGDTFRHVVLLSKPDASGSRSWSYAPEFYAAKKAYYDSLGITKFEANAIKETPLHNSILSRVSANVVSISETNSIAGDPARPEKEFVQYIMPL